MKVFQVKIAIFGFVQQKVTIHSSTKGKKMRFLFYLWEKNVMFYTRVHLKMRINQATNFLHVNAFVNQLEYE